MTDKYHAERQMIILKLKDAIQETMCREAECREEFQAKRMEMHDWHSRRKGLEDALEIVKRKGEG